MGDGERPVFEELQNPDFSKIPLESLAESLYVLASGCKAFGYWPEWTNWFSYLAPHLLKNGSAWCGLHYLLEPLITASIIMQQPASDNPLVGMKSLLIETVGQGLMQSQFWTEAGDYFEFDTNNNPKAPTYNCSGPLCASMSYLILSLEAEQIDDWVKSFMVIDGVVWHANLLSFIKAGREYYYKEPFSLMNSHKVYPFFGWQDDHLIGDNAFNDCRPKLDLFFESVFNQLTEAKLLAWCEEIWLVPEMGELFNQSFVAEELVKHVQK